MYIRCNDILLMLWESGEYPARVKQLGSGEREGKFYANYLDSGKGSSDSGRSPEIPQMTNLGDRREVL